MGRGSPGILVRDCGFQDDDWRGEFVRWRGEDDHSALPDRATLDVENTAPAEDIVPLFERIALIRITFPSHMDGRGFSLARHLRLLGYRGRLRATGHILADQYVMARRSGFDEVEIDRALAQRQRDELRGRRLSGAAGSTTSELVPRRWKEMRAAMIRS